MLRTRSPAGVDGSKRVVIHLISNTFRLASR